MGGDPHRRAPEQRAHRCRVDNPGDGGPVGCGPRRVPHCEGVAHCCGACGRGAEGDPVGAVLMTIGSGAKADDQPAAGDRVDGAELLGGQLRRPEAGREHRDSELRASCHGGGSRKRRDGVEGRVGLDASRRLEVVVDPQGIDVGCVEQRGRRADLIPGRPELREPDADAGNGRAQAPMITISCADGAAACTTAEIGIGAVPVVPRSPARRVASAWSPTR